MSKEKTSDWLERTPSARPSKKVWMLSERMIKESAQQPVFFFLGLGVFCVS